MSKIEVEGQSLIVQANQGKGSESSIEELNAAYEYHVTKQLSQLPLEETIFRRTELDRTLIPNKMGIWQTVASFGRHAWKNVQSILRSHSKIILASAACCFVFLACVMIAAVVLPQTIQFAFSENRACVISPALFPDLLHETATAFLVTRPASVSIGKTALFSNHLCVSPHTAPTANNSYLSRQTVYLAGLGIKKTIHIKTAAYVHVAPQNLTQSNSQSLPLMQEVKFKLSSADNTYKYALSANGKVSPCVMSNNALSCSLAPLNLAYATHYQLSLVRVFHSQLQGMALTKPIQTITATGIVQASIASESTIYDAPQQITLQTNKPLASLGSTSLTYVANNKTVSVPITSSFKGDSITVAFTSALPRKTKYDLRITNATATDQSQLEQAYDLGFSTSGGPKVTGSNIPSFGLNSGQTMVLSFDQALGANQDPTQFASLLVNGVKQAATESISGSNLIVKPITSFPVCATVTVQLTATAQNAYGISGDSTWSYPSRSHCYTIFSIGTSVNGRPITAYQFGSGPSMVLYIAAMEGNEQNSANLLQQWIPNVDANPSKIPSYRTLVIIPQINPDGYNADTRLNANGIDLNRNFPANNWQQQVTEPTAPTTWTNDGGPNPLSEPESQALANFYEAHKPRLTLTEHSHGGIVEPNDASDSIALGAQYASLAGYREIPTSSIGNFFNYTTTGAFEDWANDKFGLPVLEVELRSATTDEYSYNLPALWAMAQVSQ